MSEKFEIPTTPDEITPAWLAMALRSKGLEATVNFLAIEPLGGGYVGETVRIRPVYEHPAKELPATLIAKFSHPDVNLRQALLWAYEREDFFYKTLAQQVSLITPTCFFSAVNTETFCSILLLQDLAHLRRVDRVQGCGLEDAQTVLTHLARHHAQWWQDPRLPKMEAYIKPINERWMETDEAQLELLKTDWARFTEVIPTLLHNSYLPASFLAMGARTFDQLLYLYDQLAASPFTLQHGDTHLDNMMFAADGNDHPLTTLDWQLIGYGPGVCDITYFMIWSVPVSLRRQAEHDLLQTYHATLVESGVTDYSFEQCWRDYRLSFFRTFNVFVSASANLDLTGPRGRTLIDATAPRLTSFAEDHHVEEFLR